MKIKGRFTARRLTMAVMGIALVLLGIWLWPKGGLWTGVAWALAAMARAEAWIFSLGMLVATYFRRAHERERLLATVAWIALILAYMKLLLDRTGNAIYPVYWNRPGVADGWRPEDHAVRRRCPGSPDAKSRSAPALPAKEG